MQRILIVEDQKRLAASIRRGLEEEGFAVSSASTGEEGFYLATTQSTDAVILDVMLPGRDGFQVLADLRRSWPSARISSSTARNPLRACDDSSISTL